MKKKKRKRRKRDGSEDDWVASNCSTESLITICPFDKE